jgi:hypothetical protein
MITVPQVDPCPAVIGCAYLAANEPTGSCLTPTSYNGGSSATIAAGHYCTTLQISGVNNVTFSPGVYRFDNGLSINGGSSVTGNGVTFYDPGGSIAISGVSSLSLTAPASGNTIGILMYQPPSNTSAFGFGGGGNGLAGMLYFPTSNVSLNGALSKWFFVIANTVSINGGTISVASSSFPSTVSHAVLGE